MKKIAIISLLLIFCFQMFGVFLLYKVKQAEIRHEVKMRIKSGVPNENLTRLQFAANSVANLRWVDDHEFIFQEQMYDIVKTIHSTDSITYLCLPDYEEMHLFKNLNAIVTNDLNQDKSSNVQKNMVPVNWMPPANKSFTFQNLTIAQLQNTPYQFFISSSDQIPESPPPKT